MKKLLIGVTLLASVSSFASVVECKSYLPQGNNWEPVSVLLGDGIIKVENTRDRKVIETLETSVDGEGLASCIDDKDNILNCLDTLIPDSGDKNDSKRSLYSNLVMVSETEKDDLFEGVDSVAFDISKVRRGKVSAAGFGGYYPNPGLYEYFDKDGKLVARFLHNVLPVPCI